MALAKAKDPTHSMNLIRNYGRRALLAMATYGVGESTAERILSHLHPTEDAFLDDIIEAQKTFIKNRKYWKPD